MKHPARIIIASLLVSVLPVAAFAAKGEGKKNATPSFATVDKNGDGKVSMGEYTSAMSKGGDDQSAKAAFAALDKNSDGNLSAEEFAAADSGKKKGKKKKDS